jgi:hypothetical protein
MAVELAELKASILNAIDGSAGEGPLKEGWWNKRDVKLQD